MCSTLTYVEVNFSFCFFTQGLQNSILNWSNHSGTPDGCGGGVPFPLEEHQWSPWGCCWATATCPLESSWEPGSPHTVVSSLLNAFWAPWRVAKHYFLMKTGNNISKPCLRLQISFRGLDTIKWSSQGSRWVRAVVTLGGGAALYGPGPGLQMIRIVIEQWSSPCEW